MAGLLKPIYIPELLYQACEGFIEPHHTYMLQTIRKDIKQTEAIIVDLIARIKAVLSPYENVRYDIYLMTLVSTRSPVRNISPKG